MTVKGTFSFFGGLKTLLLRMIELSRWLSIIFYMILFAFESFSKAFKTELQLFLFFSQSKYQLLLKQ